MIRKRKSNIDHINSDNINYDNLLERGCLILELKKNKSLSNPKIPGSLYITEGDLKNHLHTLTIAARPVLVIAEASNELRSITKKLNSVNIEYYVGGTPEDCYNKLKEHQCSWL